MAVDNEPEPFWEGHDEAQRIGEWSDRVAFDFSWGVIEPVGDLNGSSGRWVTEQVLETLDTDRSDAWITDCLDTYRCSGALNRALRERFMAFAQHAGLGPARLPDLADHPSEAAIVGEARAEHLDRLRREIATAQPEVLVTLGNAALRVVRALAEDATNMPAKLIADGTYGTPGTITLAGRTVSWYPLAHPAAPRAFQEAHHRWRDRHG